VQSVAETSEFLKEQGKIPDVLADYAPYVTAKYVSDALATN
jgi:taurine transport system substrate-binding protein